MQNNKYRPISTTQDAELVVAMSIEQIKKVMVQQAKDVSTIVSGEMREKVLAIVNASEEELLTYAIQTKVESIWLLYSQKGILAARAEVDNVHALCARYFEGKKKVSAIDIVNIVNLYAHKVHTALLENGDTFAALQKKYACDERISTELYQLALEKTDILVHFLNTTAESIQNKVEPSFEEMIWRSMEVFGEYYQACHIVQQYCQQQGVPMDELV